jgi:hypothetical protein
MGTQQLLLIIVGVVLVGIMIAVGLFMFRDQAAATNRDSISNDLAHLASNAQAYHRRPRILGGGEGSFTGLTLYRLTKEPSNSNGTYSLDPDPVTGTPASVRITGVGTELGANGTDNVTVVMVVFPDSVYVDAGASN